MSAFCYYDIETYEADTAADIIGTKEFTAPANYKDPAKIESYINEQKAKAMLRAALHWTTGKVVAICAIRGDGIFKMAGDNEKEILTDFDIFLSGDPDTTLVGKSNHKFDDGYLIGRYLVNNIDLPRALCRDTKDINRIFGWGNNHPQQAKLNSYAIALGIGTKSADGSDVAGMVERNEWDEIADYCLQDVKLTKAIGTRFEDLGGLL